METLREKRKKRKRYRALKRVLFAVVILSVALVGLWMGKTHPLVSRIHLGDNEVQFHFVDVGQGDAALIRTSEGNILVDAGTGQSEEGLRAYLDDLGIEKIRYAVFTHPDEDHIGGADTVLRNYDVETVVLPRAEMNTSVAQAMLRAIEQEQCEVVWAMPKMEFSLGNLTCEILAPLGSDYEETNDLSIVLRVEYGETSVLFTGDAGEASERDLVREYGSAPGGALDCDLVKIGHHGSDTSSGQAFLDAVTPDFGVISCGAGNPHGHPAPTVLRLLQAMGTTVYRTDLDGSVVFSSTGGEPIKS